jgi:hypothetical protein
MPTVYAYTDPYLAPLVTQEREARAIDDVANYGAFPAEYTERLVRLRAYVLTCQESQRAPDDLFSAKLTMYGKEFRELMPLARAAQDAATSETGTGSVFSIPLERA